MENETKKVSLFNDDDSRTEQCNDIEFFLKKPVQDIIQYCKENNVSLRDAQLISTEYINCEFLCAILFG